MSDTIDALKSALPPQEPTQAELIARMVAEHKAAEDEEQSERLNPFDLIGPGGAVKINTAEEADAVARLLVDADRRLADVEAIEAKRVAREKSRATRLHGIFENALASWARWQLEGKKRRSVLLPHAELKLRKVAEHNQTFSDAELTAWAEREYVDAVEYRPKVFIEKVKEWEAKNRKPAPGRIHIDASEKFDVSIPKAKEEANERQAG